MKKKLILIVTLIFILGLSACSKDEPKKDTPTQTPTQTVTEAPTSEPVNTVVTDVVTPTEEPVEVTPTDSEDTQTDESNSNIVVPTGSDGQPLATFTDENGVTEYVDDLEKDFIQPELSEEQKNNIIHIITDEIDYSRDKGYMGYVRKTVLEYLIPQFPNVSEEDLKKLVDENYPFSREDEAEYFINFLVDLGTPKDKIREEMEMYDIDTAYLDKMEIDDLVILANDIKTFLEEHPAMTKYNAYELLIDDGWTDTDARKVLDEIFVPLTEEELKAAIQKDPPLREYCSTEEGMTEYLQRYKDELEF